MPISISSGPSSKVGLPAIGTVHDVRAMPMLRAVGVRPCGRARPPRAAARPLLGRRAADLLGQDRGADAAASGGVQAVLHRHVVVDDHRLDLDALVAGQLGRHLEVHDVAGVVLDDVQHAGAAVDGLRGRQHLVGRGRGEHLAGAGGVEHAHADEAAVHGLVAGAAARRRSPPCRGTGASARTM